jgi:glycosyltransferase involved in cell wall biosynthesis
VSAHAPIGRPLRVGLNLVFLGQRGGGVGRYASELPGALLAAEPDTELHVFVSRDAPEQLRHEPWADSVRWVTLPLGLDGPPVHVPAQFALLPLLARARRLDVLHSPANTGPALTPPGLASVITLHDLIWLHHAAEWDPDPLVQRRMRVLVNHCARHVDRLFTDSAAAAEDIARTLGVQPQRIDVTPLGVRLPAPPSAASERDVRAKLEVGDARIVLCVAQKRRYKGLHTLVRALPELPRDTVLVIPGAHTAYEDELRSLAGELGVGARLRLPQWVSEAELERLYEAASVFALPSLIEGFGLPVLEAMARGAPVACSEVSALPEVAGDAALLFDPRSQQAVTAALARLLGDAALRSQLVQRGRARAQQFSWRRTGEASLAGYRRALRPSHPASSGSRVA